MFDSIIFDLDGTLWDSTVPICESWNVVLKRHAEIKRPPVTINELGECMGLPMYDIAAKLFPLESKEYFCFVYNISCLYGRCKHFQEVLLCRNFCIKHMTKKSLPTFRKNRCISK